VKFGLLSPDKIFEVNCASNHSTMAKEENLFEEIGNSIKSAEISQMFGKPALKINGKAFSCFFENCMVFKLTGESHSAAIKLKGSKLFDPSGTGRAMKEWVQISPTHKSKWETFANEAMAYVKKSTK
jgi:hypothetical protein